jgi:Surface-adhesin protein E
MANQNLIIKIRDRVNERRREEMKKLFYIFISLYLFSPTLIYGAETDGDRWFFYFKDLDGNKQFIDKLTVSHSPDGISAFWNKIAYGKPKRNGATVTRGHTEIDCNLNRWRALTITDYDSQGHVIDIVPMPLPWLDVPPESPLELASVLLCKAKSFPGKNWMKLNAKGDTTLYIDKENFEYFPGEGVTVWLKLVHGITKKDGTVYSLDVLQVNCNSNKFKMLWTAAYDSQGDLTNVPLGPDGSWHDIQPMSIPAAISVVLCQPK